jgi:release factor glutamine methyltransferase
VTSPATEKTSGEGEWTVGKIIDWTTAHLKKHGSDAPRLEAEILLAHTRRCPRIQLYVQYNELLSTDERTTMRELVKRRAQSEPVAYLVGHREFFGINFQVSPAVLIPRPETETLVMETLALTKALPAPRILDLCTGSGCIAVAVAVNHKTADLTAIDISAEALAMARENVARHGVQDRVQLLQGSLFEPLPENTRFDVIVSNPPYVAAGEIATLPPDVRLHEPHLALSAGPQGLDCLTPLIRSAGQYLTPGGTLIAEFSPEQATAVSALVEASGAYASWKLVKDAGHQIRAVVARLKSH